MNSKTATLFRQWATKTLREHITEGYTINRKRVAQNYDAFMKAVADIQVLLPEHMTLDPKNVLDLIKEFATTWVSLDAYDKELLTVQGVSKKSVHLTSDELHGAIGSLKKELMKRGEATDLFAMAPAPEKVGGDRGKCHAINRREAGICDGRGKGGAPAVFHGKKSPIYRRQ